MRLFERVVDPPVQGVGQAASASAAGQPQRDAERRRHLLVLEHHVVQIVAHKGIDWTWRVERVDPPPAGLVSPND
jgi:hypothetical protein